MVDVDQISLRDDWCLRKDRHEASSAGASQRAQSSRSDPRNKASPVAPDRRGTYVVATQGATGRSPLLGIIAHGAPPSHSATGFRQPSYANIPRLTTLNTLETVSKP